MEGVHTHLMGSGTREILQSNLQAVNKTSNENILSVAKEVKEK